MNKSSIWSMPFIFFLIYIVNCEQLYNFDLSNKVNINGQSHFKINYYPGSTSSAYKGDYYPDIEANLNIKKYTFINNCTILRNTNFATEGIITPTLDTVKNPLNYVSDLNSALIVPVGVTVTIKQLLGSIPIILIKGRVELDPSFNSKYMARKTIIFPGGVFESIPISSVNHTVNIENFEDVNNQYPVWDPLRTSSFISLGGTVTIKGFNSESVWMGSNNSFPSSSYGGTFLRSFPFTSNKPVFKMSGSRATNNVVYSMDNYYTRITSNSVLGTYDPFFNGAGYIYMHPWDKNVWISGSFKSSILFTGGSKVDIQNSVFYDIGHTTISPLNENIIDSTGNVISIGLNPSDRYPITLLHNTIAVNIKNNMFMPNSDYSNTAIQLSQLPRSYIGAKRSFGNIIGNAFSLKNGGSGISLLYGTEQFNCSLNSFISLYTDTSLINGGITSRSYPDIDFINGGIITTSPYSIFIGNAFEGKFKGGAYQAVPLQNRQSLAGLSSDLLLGQYNGMVQDNTLGFKINNQWSSVIYSNNFFAGEAEFRVTFTSEPSIKINFSKCWFIAYRPSLTLTSNIANIEISYDSPYIASSLSINDKKYIFNVNSHIGTYNAISIKNSYAPSGYTFFADTFHCKYISIKDSIFSHYSSTSNFISKYTNQIYFKNVNGTKTNFDDSIQFLYPFYNLDTSLSIVGSGDKEIIASFIPNFDFPSSDGQSIEYLIDGVERNYISNLNQADYSNDNNTVTRPLQLDNKANGLYNVFISAKAYQPFNAPITYSESGPFYANTFTIDQGLSINFYLGIDLSLPIAGSTADALSIFGHFWTKCVWISGSCQTTGVYNSVVSKPTFVNGITSNDIVSGSNEINMLTSYLGNDIIQQVPSTINIVLEGQQQYKFYIYSYNPLYTGIVCDTLPQFTIKINGKYQEPYTRTVSPYQKYQKFGPFYWNNPLATVNTLVIEWASDNMKYVIPISGIEIYSSKSTPFSIPSSSNGGGAIGTGSVDNPNHATSLLSTSSSSSSLLFITIFISFFSFYLI